MKDVKIKTTFGLGDAVAFVATPIARVLGMPCVDPKTNQLRPESPCNQRKTDWNAAVPDVLHPFRNVDKGR